MRRLDDNEAKSHRANERSLLHTLESRPHTISQAGQCLFFKPLPFLEPGSVAGRRVRQHHLLWQQFFIGFDGFRQTRESLREIVRYRKATQIES